MFFNASQQQQSQNNITIDGPTNANGGTNHENYEWPPPGRRRRHPAGDLSDDSNVQFYLNLNSRFMTSITLSPNSTSSSFPSSPATSEFSMESESVQQQQQQHWPQPGQSYNPFQILCDTTLLSGGGGGLGGSARDRSETSSTPPPPPPYRPPLTEGWYVPNSTDPMVSIANRFNQSFITIEQNYMDINNNPTSPVVNQEGMRDLNNNNNDVVDENNNNTPTRRLSNGMSNFDMNNNNNETPDALQVNARFAMSN